jgi:hypothetical protein
MMNNVDNRVIALMKQMITWFVNGDFADVEVRSRGVRLSAELMRQAIEEYGRTLIMPPNEAFSSVDVIQVANADRLTWSVSFDLWTKEEGRSDLSVECTIVDREDGAMLDLEIDNIHVL